MLHIDTLETLHEDALDRLAADPANADWFADWLCVTFANADEAPDLDTEVARFYTEVVQEHHWMQHDTLADSAAYHYQIALSEAPGAPDLADEPNVTDPWGLPAYALV